VGRERREGSGCPGGGVSDTAGGGGAPGDREGSVDKIILKRRNDEILKQVQDDET